MQLFLGLAGAALLVIGVNLPILQDPALYKLQGLIIPFWQYGDWFSHIVLGIMVAAAFSLTLLGKFHLLWLPGAGSFLIFSYIISGVYLAFQKTGYHIAPRFFTLSPTPPLISWWLLAILVLGPVLLLLAARWRPAPRRPGSLTPGPGPGGWPGEPPETPR